MTLLIQIDGRHLTLWRIYIVEAQTQKPQYLTRQEREEEES